MKRIIICGLAFAMIACPALAADFPTKAPITATADCRLPSGDSSKFTFECAGLSLSLGAMYIQRQPTHGTVLTPNATPGFPMVSGDNLHFGWSLSPELIARYRFGGGWALEGRYFNSRPSDVNYNVPGVSTFRIAGIGVTILGGGQLDTTYSSHLSSFELNASKELIPGVTVLAGYRQFNLHENLQVGLDGTGLNISTWDETNRLNGGQVGVNFGFVSPVLPLHFNAAFKAGIYNNSATNTFTSQVVASATSSGSKQAYSGEANLTATYYVNNRWSVQASYMALLLKDVALSDMTAQGTTQTAGGTSSPIGNSNVWYNAASLRVAYDF